jgi:hypothetical protein
VLRAGEQQLGHAVQRPARRFPVHPNSSCNAREGSGH